MHQFSKISSEYNCIHFQKFQVNTTALFPKIPGEYNCVNCQKLHVNTALGKRAGNSKFQPFSPQHPKTKLKNGKTTQFPQSNE
jgi:hypothetical protein